MATASSVICQFQLSQSISPLTSHSQAANQKTNYFRKKKKAEIWPLRYLPAKINYRLLHDSSTNAKTVTDSCNLLNHFGKIKGGFRRDKLIPRVKRVNLVWVKKKSVLCPSLSLKEVVVCSMIQRQLQKKMNGNNSFQFNKKDLSWNQPSLNTRHFNQTLRISKIWTASQTKKLQWSKRYKRSPLLFWEPMNHTTPTAASMSLSDLSGSAIKQRTPNAASRLTTWSLKKLKGIYSATTTSSFNRKTSLNQALSKILVLIMRCVRWGCSWKPSKCL